MIDVAITRFRKRLRLPTDALGERNRIDRAIAYALGDEMFDSALQRAGVTEADEVCIRRVQSVVRLDSHDDDMRLATACSVALANAIATELEDGAGSANVIRYASKHQGLLEMAVGIARGDCERAWAWRQLGLWTHPELEVSNSVTIELLFDALKRNPHSAAHVLAHIGDAGLLDELLLQTGEAHWRVLGQQLLALFGTMATTSAAEVFEESVASKRHDYINDAFARLHAVADRVRARSRILHLRRTTLRAVSQETVRALATIALIECEPDALLQPNRADVISQVTQRMLSETRHSENVRSESTGDRRNDEATINARTRQHTSYGGLLFLVHAVRALQLPEVIAVCGELSSRTLSWVLRHVGASLIRTYTPNPPGPDQLWHDAAVRAFSGACAGAGNDDEMWSTISCTAQEDMAIDSIASSMVKFVHERLANDDMPSESEVMSFVIVRNAEIVAESAWVEVRLRVADTSTDIRRAGLDLNPDWLPWIGTIMRFTYE